MAAPQERLKAGVVVSTLCHFEVQFQLQKDIQQSHHKREVWGTIHMKHHCYVRWQTIQHIRTEDTDEIQIVQAGQNVNSRHSFINSNGVGEAFGKIIYAHTKPSGFQFHCRWITQARPACLVIFLIFHNAFYYSVRIVTRHENHDVFNVNWSDIWNIGAIEQLVLIRTPSDGELTYIRFGRIPSLSTKRIVPCRR